MRALIAAGLTLAALLALAGCNKTAQSPAGSPASASAGPTVGSSQSSGGSNSVSCTIMASPGKIGTCTIYNYPNAAAATAGRSICASANQTAGVTCSTQDLLGCCTTKTPLGYTTESCIYKIESSPEGFGATAQAHCTASAGAWSATP